MAVFYKVRREVNRVKSSHAQLATHCTSAVPIFPFINSRRLTGRL